METSENEFVVLDKHFLFTSCINLKEIQDMFRYYEETIKYNFMKILVEQYKTKGPNMPNLP